MKMSGTGISTPVDLRIISFEVVTRLALQWTKSTSGNWYASDRGATADVYECKASFHALRYQIDVILEAFESNRSASSNVVSLTEFNQTDDLIFGADVDYDAGISATVLKLDSEIQKSWKGFSLTLEMRTLSPSFKGTATLPALNYLARNYEGDASYTVTKQDSYTGAYAYADEGADAGTWQGQLTMSTDNLTNLRRYQATQRGTAFSLAAIQGITYPFGPRRGDFPLNVKILSVEEKSMRDKKYWQVNLKLAESVSET